MRRLAHDREVSSICLSSKYIFTGSADTTVKQWDIESGECVGYYAGNSLAITSLCAGPEDTLITGGISDLLSNYVVTPSLLGHFLIQLHSNYIVTCILWRRVRHHRQPVEYQHHCQA